MSHEENIKTEEGKKEFLDGEIIMSVKEYTKQQGISELVDRIYEVIGQDQSRILIDKAVIIHGKRFGERLFK